MANIRGGCNTVTQFIVTAKNTKGTKPT